MKSITSAVVNPWRSNGAGFVGNGWVRAVFSPATVDCGSEYAPGARPAARGYPAPGPGFGFLFFRTTSTS